MSEDGIRLIYGLVCLVLVASALSSRRLPLGQAWRMALAWLAIFAIGFMLFLFKDDFRAIGRQIGQRLNPEAGVTAGATLRIPMADDGHFWVRGRINGIEIRFLIDSGATTTALSQAAVTAAGIAVDPSRIGTAISTANGTVIAQRLRIDELALGPILRRDLAAMTAPEFGDINVLGMNFLSSLARWEVDGRTLILTA